MKPLFSSLLVMLCMLLFMCGCDEDNSPNPDGDGTTDGDAVTDGDVDMTDVPDGHTENLDGTWHKPGKEDPLSNCTACHGANLDGGVGSCYACHNSSDHNKNRSGVKHQDGSSSSCSTCHGPNNGGGLGPACNECH